VFQREKEKRKKRAMNPKVSLEIKGKREKKVKINDGWIPVG
jgi:hypothetical protein